MRDTQNKSRRLDREKTDSVKEEKTQRCKVICICSVTSSIHIVIPLVKCLSRLGTVQVVSEDKSILLLSNEMTPSFDRGDVVFRYEEEIALVEDFMLDSAHYTVVITQEYLPTLEIDKFIILNNRHYFRSQFESVEQKYTPIMSVLNPTGLTREQLTKEKSVVYVNEVLLPAPSYVSMEQYINTLLMQVGTQELKFDSRIINFIVEALNGIEGCTKTHIKQCLMERGDTFASIS